MKTLQLKENGYIIKDHNFSPRDEREVNFLKAIETAANFLAYRLGVCVILTVERQSSWAGADACYLGRYMEYEKENRWKHVLSRRVKVNMRNLYGATLERILSTLGHEFRHAVQYQKGIMDKGLPDTNRECISYFSYTYWNSDEEKDARKYQKAYADMAIRDTSFEPYRYLLSDTVSGSPVMVADYPASYAALGLNKEKDGIALFRFRDEVTGKALNNYFWFRLSEVNGSPKKWTKKVFQRVYAEHEPALRKQPFPVLQRQMGLDEMYM